MDSAMYINSPSVQKRTGLQLVRITTAMAVISLLAGCMLESQPDRSHPPMEITNNPQTYCIGRVLIDLPQSLSLNSPDVAASISGNLKLDGMRITTRTNVSKAEFEQLVNARWKEVQSYKTPSGKPYAQPSARHNIRTNGVLLAFKHRMIRSNARWVNGQREFDNLMVNEAEGYFWDNGTMFVVKDGGYDNVNEKIANVLSQMSHMRLGDIPDEPGICVNGGFIALHYRSMTESYLWSATLPRGLSVSFYSGTDVREKPMLSLFSGLPRANLENSSMVYGTRQYRAAHRSDGHLPADEIINGVTKGYEEPGSRPSYKTSIEGRWEYMGQRPPNAAPFVRVEMELGPIKTDHRPADMGGFPAKTENAIHPTQEEFMAVWDMIMGSIRFYPGALNNAPKPPDRTRPGPSAQQITSDKQVLDDFLDGWT